MGLGYFLLEIGKCPPHSHLNPAIDVGISSANLRLSYNMYTYVRPDGAYHLTCYMVGLNMLHGRLGTYTGLPWTVKLETYEVMIHFTNLQDDYGNPSHHTTTNHTSNCCPCMPKVPQRVCQT